MSTAHNDHVFYQPGQHWPWGFAIKPANGDWMDQAGNTLQTLASRYPGIQVCTEAEAVEQIEALSKKPVEAIDAETFDDALCVLPPLHHTFANGAESFKMCERLNGRVTRIYVRIGKDHYRFADVDTMSHAEAVATVRAAAPALSSNL